MLNFLILYESKRNEDMWGLFINTLISGLVFDVKHNEWNNLELNSAILKITVSAISSDLFSQNGIITRDLCEHDTFHNYIDITEL